MLQRSLNPDPVKDKKLKIDTLFKGKTKIQNCVNSLVFIY